MKLGDYELLREHGAIGAGTVWLARTASDTGENPKLFSVVRVHKHLIKKPEIAAAFVADAKPAVGFRHAHVAALVQAGDVGGELVAISEHHEGELLSALFTAAGAEGLPLPVVVRVALDVFEALAAAHESDPPIFHGEIGPHHVLVGNDGIARVLGLGIASGLSRIAPPVGAKSQDRLAYAAPERVKAMSAPLAPATVPLDARVDLFSVGVMLWEGVAKQRLFASKIDAAVVQKVLTGSIAALSTMGAPEALDAAVQKVLERDPAKRTQSAAMMIAALEGLDPDRIATRQQVTEVVTKLAGKATADVSKAVAAAPAAKRGEPRKATLLGIPAPGKPAAPGSPPASKPEPAPPAGSKPVSPSKPESKPGSTPKPAVAAPPDLPPPRPPALSAEEISEVIEVEESPKAEPPKPPPVPPKRPGTLLLGSPAGKAASAKEPESAKPEAPKPAAPEAPKPAAAESPKPAAAEAPKAVAEAPKPPAPPKPAAEAPKAVAEAPKPPAPPKPAAEAPKAVAEAPKPPAPPKPAAPAQPVESPSKTSHTPSSDERSPASRAKGIGTEKVGPGSTLGRYEVLMPVARGGMASVWAARLPGSRGFTKIFAIKTMLPDVSDDPDFENMFLDEGRIAARIRHPSVVEIIDLGEQEEVLYLVMEWVEGENLGALVKAARAVGGIPLPIVLRIASQIAAGLHAAHELRDDDGNLVDLVHRDVSPANVLVSTSGYVKIVDFGIAKSKGRLHQTRVGGVVKGKTPYLSPEQLGQLPIDRRSDIFSLGVLLYVLTTGLHPFRGDTDTKTIENIALREPVPLRSIVAATPPEFEAIVLKALHKDPKGRFATAAEIHRAIEQVAATSGMTTTEEDVAAFVKKALGETITKRAQELRAAIDRADGRVPSTVDDDKDDVDPLAATEMLPEGGAVKNAAVTMPDLSGDAKSTAAKPADDEDVSIDDVAKAPTPHFAVPPPPPEPEPPPAADTSTRAASPSDGAEPIEVPGALKRRKPVVQIAVGAVLGIAAIIGGIAIFGGGGKPAEPARPAVRTGTSTTAAPARTGTPAPPPAQTAAAPVQTAAATPVETATAAPAETAPPVAAPAETATAAPVSKPLPGKPGPSKPSGKPGSTKKPPSGKFNPTGI